MTTLRDELYKLAEELELVGNWVMSEGLPCPDEIWRALDVAAAHAVTNGLLYKIKGKIQHYDVAAMQTLLDVTGVTDKKRAEDLYYLFVYYEYPQLKRAVQKLAPPPPLKFFKLLCAAIRDQMKGSGNK